MNKDVLVIDALLENEKTGALRVRASFKNSKGYCPVHFLKVNYNTKGMYVNFPKYGRVYFDIVNTGKRAKGGKYIYEYPILN